MKAEDTGLGSTANAREIDVATAIGRELVMRATSDMARMLQPLMPLGKEICVSTTLCVIFKATVEIMVAIDREATNALMLAASDGLNGTGEDVQARQLAAQEAMARAEVINETRSDARGTA